MTLTTLRRGLLLFWALWLSVVAVTNLNNALQVLGLLPADFLFISGNWKWINDTLDPLAVPRGVKAFLFAGVIAWEALAAGLFWRAAAVFRGRPLAEEPAALWACGVNLALWGAFQILDEVFLAYSPEAVHRVIFLSQLGTLALLHVLGARHVVSGAPTQHH